MSKFVKDTYLSQSGLQRVSSGSSRIYKGWTSPINYREKQKTGIKDSSIKLIDPQGNVVEFRNKSDASSIIKVSSSNISYLCSGKYNHCKGYRKYSEKLISDVFNSKKYNSKKAPGKMWSFIDPNGCMITFQNLKNFCACNNLNVKCM